ncbi:SRPBCC domain-containing protein [Dactylosporangium sp. CS-047395]|uniref:SRPBCC domain-containing protein n=1 Tax=Dactylosporangium sp. CS-047395 TaxID=3239936 RepID=UPI003D93051E
MTTQTRILGTLRTADGKGVVRVQDRFDGTVDDLWSALTDPVRLSRWLGEFDGDLWLGGTFRARFFASEWQGTGRVDVCEPPHRLAVTTRDAEGAEEHVIEATLAADGDGTVVTFEERGVPVGLLPAYGAGVQIHLEDLGAHLAGRERCDARARWRELHPAYAAAAEPSASA